MQNAAINMARLAAMDSREATLLLKGIREAVLRGGRAPLAPRADIGASWRRVLREGVDPDRDRRPELLPPAELEARRGGSPLAALLPLLREGLMPVPGGGSGAVRHIMVVADADGRVLWREGHPAVLRMADGHGFAPGADWRESAVGTNAVGTALVVRRPVQVHSAEHFVAAYHTWTCAGAPITDPRDGRLAGVLNVSGPVATAHPATPLLVGSVARLAEAELRNRHLAGLARLRAVAAPLLYRAGGRAVAVDRYGWTAAVTGLAPVDRVPLPSSLSAGRRRLPTLGECDVEPLPGGWLVRPLDAADARAGSVATRLVLDVSRPREWTVRVSGAVGSWTRELSPRHAELLYVLAVRRDGRTAAELAADVFGDRTRTVTVRAEMSRMRRTLGGVLAHRPYRFRDGVEVEVVAPADAADLLPYSTAPAVLAARHPAADRR
ncbi:GAF domain-containing protein [Streptomyces somaliensis]|uniref:GAF domain-containing protein n=1 Tax=Streptomyces somaliensis TaxID=78355 RepID=UPI0020CC333F|nr:GAF domain-containing protein [Streptomyces somaliensis]MCP9943788.1 GAF domain-containing protein [Streptomyces somaliensis]MCP9962959.1 GAF domain-containing protein [Streptomyces somaliensis]MCP9975807.1 GAF domain-containing protein [Streptomyces somaliensis]